MDSYARLIEASDPSFAERCPIPVGVYTIRHWRIDLDKIPPMKKGFNGTATITVHKGENVLSKMDTNFNIWF